MPLHRFFDATLSLQQDANEELLRLEGSEAHHALHVVRLKEQDTFEVINGAGLLVEAQTVQVGRSYIIYRIKNASQSVRPSKPPLILLQGALAKEKLELVVEKATELGTQGIIVAGTQKSKAHLGASIKKSSSLFELLEKKMQGALKQSGHLWLPKLHLLEAFFDPKQLSSSSKKRSNFPSHPLLLSLKKLSEQLHHPSLPSCPIDLFDASLKILLDLPQEAGKSLGNEVLQALHSAPLLIAAGPESGWSDREIASWSELGFDRQAIHPACLRAETASIAAMSAFFTARYLLKGFNL